MKKLPVYRSKRVAWVSAKGWKGNATTYDTYSKRNMDSTKAAEKIIDGTEKFSDEVMLKHIFAIRTKDH